MGRNECWSMETFVETKKIQIQNWKKHSYGNFCGNEKFAGKNRAMETYVVTKKGKIFLIQRNFNGQARLGSASKNL